MNTRTDMGSSTVNKSGFRARISLAIAPALGLLSLAGCNEQPEVQCFGALSSGAPFTVRYDLVEMVSPGTGDTAGFCGSLTVGQVGVQTYVTNPDKPGDGINSVALQLNQMGLWMLKGRELRTQVPVLDEMGNPVLDEMGNPTFTWEADPALDTTAGRTLYALGKFTSKHPKNDVCTVGPMSAAQLTLPALPEHETAWDDEQPYLVTDDETTDPAYANDLAPAQPAIDAKAEWKNVRFYVTPGNTGTQFAGELTFTLNGCVATYRAVGVNSSSTCESNADCTVEALTANSVPVSDVYGDLVCMQSSEPDPSVPPEDPALPLERATKKLCALEGDFPVLAD
jgi:hypothetical protein